MKRTFLMIGIGVGLLVLALGVVNIVSATNRSDLDQVRAATAKYHSIKVAEDNGYGLVPGLDHCFENPGVGAMGFHYINTLQLDTSLDPNRPESMVYRRDKNGQLKLGAVEYIVPVKAWTDAGNSEKNPPTVLGKPLHINEVLGVYVLHAWIWMDNPAGIFEDWNPDVSCP